MPAVGICLLGPPVVDGDGALAPRDRMVLGVLAVRRGQVVTPDQVADAVWGDQPPSSWPTQVQICVGRLRKVLGATAIETIAGGYRLTLSGDEVDVDRFEQLVEHGRGLAATGDADRAAIAFTKALGLWRGRPFEDLDGWEPGSSEAARLEELRRSVEEELLDARLAAGEHRQVAASAEALVAAEPLRERRWAILALAQYRCGRQADALRSLARARRLLVDQLGIDPGLELVSLEAAILRQDDTLAAPEQPAAVSGECPYKGLAAYDVGDADVFFGRDQEVAECLERLRSTPLLVVAGPSGCGKSSLVRAGLLPALARGGRPAVVIVPGGDPDGAMSAALGGAEGTPVLVVDQFEALFTVTIDPDVARAFCRRITRYAEDQAPVVICVRADHLTGLSVDTDFARLAEQGLHLVSPLAADRLREAIEQPAIQAGYRLEPGLVDLLVRDTEGEPGALPLLSHALVETWRRRDGHVLTVEGYRASGGIRGAVARSADRLYDNLPAEQRAMLRGILLRLVTPSVDGDPVRCRVPTRSLIGDRQREQVVALLVRARLVTAEADTVELAHEALARAWPRLQSWLDEDAAGLRILRHLATAAAGWDSLDRPDSELYRGARLDTALEWRATTQTDLTDVETAFLDASVDPRRERTGRPRGPRSTRRPPEPSASRRPRRRRPLRRRLPRRRAHRLPATPAGRRSAPRCRARGADRQLRGVARQQRRSRRPARRRSPPPRPERCHRVRPVRLVHQLPWDRAHGSARRRRTGWASSVAAGRQDDRRHRPGELGAPHRRRHGTDRGSSRRSAGGWPVALSVSRRPLPRRGGDRRFRSGAVDAHGVGPAAPGSDASPTSRCRSMRASVAIDADGSQVAVAGGFDGRTLIYDAATGDLQRELDPLPRPADAQLGTNTVAVEVRSADGRLIVTSQAGPIRFIDPATGTELGRIDGPEQTSETNVIVSPDGGSMTTFGVHGVMRYALPSGEPLWTQPADVDCNGETGPIMPINAILCLDVRADGRARPGHRRRPRTALQRDGATSSRSSARTGRRCSSSHGVGP